MSSEEVRINGDSLRGVQTAVEVFRVLSVSLDLDQTLNAVLDGLESLIDYDAAGIYVIDPASGSLRARVARGYSEGGGPVGGAEGVVERILELGAPILSPDVATDPEYVQSRDLTRSEVAVPLLGSGGRVIGALNLESNRQNEYDAVSLELVTLFAVGAAVAIEKATLHAELMEKRRLESELEVARSVMEGLLPRELPRLEGFEVAVLHNPSRQVGGDYYDFIPIDDERWVITVADVMGKGAPAALLASALRASLHSLARNELALRSVLNKANRFFRESSREGTFATLFYAELDVKARRLMYINAGHPPALIVRKDGECEQLSCSGPPIGVIETPHYLEEFAALAPGDVIVVYTDGVTDAMNDAEQEFGLERLADAVAGARGEGAADIRRAAVEALATFNGTRFSDDLTLLVIKAM
jgi:sigma-B regulation protein RsbU (phosphoserine phosphatase)